MYPRSFLCEEAKIEQHISLKKELWEIDEEATWEYRFRCFMIFRRRVVFHQIQDFMIFQFIRHPINAQDEKWIT